MLKLRYRFSAFEDLKIESGNKNRETRIKMKEPRIINSLRHKMETEWFGVLTRYGTKLGIPVSKLRVFFIYSTFATAGIFFLFYLGLAFMLWIKDCIVTKRPSVFDL